MNKLKIISGISLLVLLLSILMPVIILATTFSVEYFGPVSYGGSTVGKFRVNGQQAFCIDHKKQTPPSGTEITEEVWDNENVLKTLYYGWGGDMPYSFDSEAQGIVYTTMALDHFVNGNRNGIAQAFIDYVNSMPVPNVTLNFTESNLTAYKEGDIQRTQTVQVTGNSSYSLNVNLQSGVTLVNESKGTRQQGNVSINGGDYFHLEAPLSVNGSWTSEPINNHKYKFQPLIYKSANASYQRLASKYKVVVDPTSTISLNVNWLNAGSLEIMKADSETGEKIANTTFALRNKNGETIDTLVTNENGYAKAENIVAGSYQLVEVSANNDYIKNDTPITIEIQPGQTKTIELTNEHKKGSLKIVKVDSRDQKTPIPNVKFEIWNLDENKLIDTLKTDENGEIFLENIRTGLIGLREIETNEWYMLDTEEKRIEVEWNKTAEVRIDNDVKTAYIEINKRDADYADKKLEGVKFNIIEKDSGKVVDTLITNKNGYAKSKALPIDKKYEIKETQTLENYIINTNELDVSFLPGDAGKTKNFNIANKHTEGNLRIYKVDKDNNKIALGGVKFQLYSEEFDKVIGEYETDVNGEIYIENLRAGEKYKLIETNTNNYYNLAPDTEITIEKDIDNIVTIENELKKGSVKVIKVDKDNHEVRIPNVVFEVQDENGKTLEIIKTNENGEADTQEYPVRDYEKLKLYEIATEENYVLNDTPITVELKENQITEITFENEKIKGYVEITKVDSKDKDKKLEGAEFGLYNENDELIDTLITDENGKATSDELYKGKYYLKELDTGSVYYLLNEDTFEFEIVNNGETVPVEIVNVPTDITVDVDKEGTTEIRPGDEVNYVFTNVANNSNVYLENFKWYDFIPTDYIRLEKMTTGTWNQDLQYDIYYKTNKSEDYILFQENVNTTEDHELDFTTVELSEDEYIVETMFDFGRVGTGFRESTSPTMQCKSLDTLQDGDTFTNHTKTVGVYYGVTAEANSDWTTITHIPEKPTSPTLPRTGK